MNTNQDTTLINQDALIDIKPLKQADIVQIIRTAESLDDAVNKMNGLAANGWLTLWDNATHPDGTSYRDKSPISQNEQQEAVAYAWEYESPDKTWKSITSNKTELQDHLEIGCTLVRELFTSPPKQIPDGWKLVPIEPTSEMLQAVLNNTEYSGDNESLMATAYKAMIIAAPTNTEVGE